MQPTIYPAATVIQMRKGARPAPQVLDFLPEFSSTMQRQVMKTEIDGVPAKMDNSVFGWQQSISASAVTGRSKILKIAVEVSVSYRIPITLALLFVPATIAFAGEKSGDVAKSLQGTWQAVYLETNGEKSSDDQVKDLKIVFQGDLVFSLKPDGENPKVKFRLDTSKNPHTIDLIPTDEKAPTMLATGIFALEDGKLKLCVNLFGKDTTKRPTEFKTHSGDGTGIGYAILERVKQ